MTEQKEEVVISGIGGEFPECKNVDELKDLLFNQVNGVTIDSRRWNPNALGAISGTGKLANIYNFDNTFFRVNPNLSKSMNPMTKMIVEKSIEAIIDAGISPGDLYGTNTAVITGSAVGETEAVTLQNENKLNTNLMLGQGRTMQANRVSFILNLTGPSYSTDGGWICGSNGLELAKKMIEEGSIPSAIVGVTNLALRPETQFQYQGLNKLNRSVFTKSFDSQADGYNRSEACVVFFLQRASDAKRSYGTLVNIKSMQFGDHQGHLVQHEKNHFKSFLVNTYKEANIDPSSVEFIEANGSGIKHEDSMELNIMDEVFCTNQRKAPLKVGSVKSNIGHCEASGLFVSIVKAIIAFESGYLPPNINYTEPNENVAALKTGQIQVVTEKVPFDGDIIGISSFGIINAFSHVILKRNNKIKKLSKEISKSEFIPRLIVASGRNEENARQTIEKIKSYGNDDEYLALTNNVFTRNIIAHYYRSFTVYPNLDESRLDDVWNVNLQKRPVWFIFSGMGSQWHGMGSNLMNLPIFADAINKCDSILKPRGVDIKNILTSQDPKLFDNILNSFVGIAAIQIGLVEVLKALEITPDGIVGHSVGELGCAYADGCFTLEEMILSAYARGRASIETKLIPGMMAAIGLGYGQIKNILPLDIDVACHNSATSCTISGPKDSINSFVSELKAKGIFAKAVNVADIAYHSRYIQSAGPTLLKYLKEVIKQPKMRSSKWISSSLPEIKWNSDLAKYSSPDYHTNNLLSSVLFEESLKHIPSDAITIEIAPHGLLQSIIKGALPDTVTNVSLTKKVFGGDSVRFLLTTIGKLYTNGLNPKIGSLYPKVTFPVSRGTPAIHTLPFWDHTEKVLPNDFLGAYVETISGEKTSEILLNDDINLKEYCIHDQHILPFSYVLIKVWKMFIEMSDKIFIEEPIQFINLHFKNNVKIHSSSAFEDYLLIQQGSGLFEYSLNDEVIFTGQIGSMYHTDMNIKSEESIRKSYDKFYGFMSKDEIYAIFENNGFNLGENFRNITNIDVHKNYIQGYVEWKNDWVYFLDGLLKFPLFENLGTRYKEAVSSIRQICVIPKIFEKNGDKDIHINYNVLTKEITCAGLKISNVVTCPIILSEQFDNIKIENESFIQFNNSTSRTIDEFIHDSFEIILESDKLNLNKNTGKLILSLPYHYDDPITKECKKVIKQIVDNVLSIRNEIINWENVKNNTDYDESGKFITVTNVNYLKDTMKALSNKKVSYVIVCSNQKLGDFKDWIVITQQKINDDNQLVLMKRTITTDGNYVFIKPASDSYDLSIWKTLEKYNSSKELICVVSNQEPLEGVSAYVNDMIRKYKSEKLRFLFIIDTNAPDFELCKSFYLDQLSIGSIVNIYKNGGWGSYKRIALHDEIDNNLANENPLNIYSTISNSKLTIKYLGLNFKDLVVEDETENEFGPIEYSGLIENNKTVMGIASFKHLSTQFKYEPLLSWPVPSTWSLQDASTVPLSYAMSYYVFKVLGKLNKEKSVLVTSGMHPIGQAAISISLNENCEVYALVESSTQADRLSCLFPELPRSRILINTKNQFDIQIKMMTKGKGIDFILNFLSGEAFESAFRAVADHGMFYNFSKSDMKNRRYLGTRQFLRDLSFFGVCSNMLLNECDHNKQIVQRAFVEGLKYGYIKPFQCNRSTIPFYTNKVFDSMRTAFKSNTPEKVVLSLDEYFKFCKSQEIVELGTYQCNPDQVYVIIDQKCDWLGLAEWLADRGAQQIVIAVNTYLMSTTTSMRFDKLISRNISVHIESDSHLQTKEESLNWLYRLTSSNVLGSIFVMNQFDDIKLNSLRYSFEEYKNRTLMTSFICIASKGKHICNELKSIGVRALDISLEGSTLQPKSIEKILSSLDTLLQKLNTFGSSSFICSEKNDNIFQLNEQIKDAIANYFPGSIDELYLLNDKITKEACFVEVQTRSPRFSQLKSVIPVFVIPGFKPKLIETLYKQLLYPAFEARLPENINSIDEISEILVNKIKNITNQGYVSLIGESWGGIIALKMAQILESKGIMVTVALLEGDPEILLSCAESLLSNNNLVNKLTALYNSFFNEYALQYQCEELQSRNISSLKSTFNYELHRALSGIDSKLRILVESKPLSNKLFTKVLILRYERATEFSQINLNDYCINPPFVHVIAVEDYKHMMMDKKMIEIISKNVIHSYPVGGDSSLSDKYKNLIFFVHQCYKNC